MSSPSRKPKPGIVALLLGVLLACYLVVREFPLGDGTPSSVSEQGSRPEAGIPSAPSSAITTTRAKASSRAAVSDDTKLPILGQVVGRIVDEFGDPVSGARIAISDRALSFRIEAVSRDDGSFRIDGVPLDIDLVLYATRSVDGDPIGFLGTTRCAEAVARDVGTLVFSRPAIVRGRVVDERGEPVSGAIVMRQGSDSERSSATDSGGRFEFSTDDGEFGVQLVASKAGFIADPRASDFVDLDLGTVCEGVELRLRAAGRVEGVVVDPLGGPVGGARLEVLGPEQRFLSPYQQDEFEPRLAETTSAADGRFSLPLPLDSTFSIAVEATGFERASMSSLEPAEPLRIVLARNRHVRLERIDARTKQRIATPPSRIGARSNHDPANPWLVDWLFGDSRVLADGTISFEAEPREAVELVICVPGYFRGLSEPIAASEFDGRTVAVALTPGGSLSGTIVDAAGKPYAEGRIEAWSHRGTADSGSRESRYFLSWVTADRSGRFQFESLPMDLAEIELVARSRDSDAEASATRIVALWPDATSQPIVLQLPQLGTVEGRVTFLGRPVPHRCVRRIQGDSAKTLTRTDEDGRFRLNDLDVAPIELVFAVDDAAGSPLCLETKTRIEVVAGRTSRIDLDLAELGYGIVRGTARVDEKPAAGGSVSFFATVGDGHESVAIDARGCFESPPIPAGRYNVCLWPRNTRAFRFERSFEVLAAQTLDLELTAATATIRGRVIDDTTGLPITDPEVRRIIEIELCGPILRHSNWEIDDEVHLHHCHPSADGSFTFERVAVGEYTVNVRCFDDRFGDDRKRFTVRAGFPTQVDFRLPPAGSLEVEVENLPDELRETEWIILRSVRDDGTKQRFDASRKGDLGPFRATGLAPGNYEMTAGIDRENEDPNVDDSFVMLGSFAVAIRSGETTTAKVRVERAR